MRVGSRLRAEVRAVYTIWLRDVIRFVHERARIVGALGQPLIYLAVIGTGMGSTFRPVAAGEAFNYIGFLYPGVLGMTILFTSMFSSISIIWDREFGFLKAILVAPVSRVAILLGKAFGGASIAMFQASLLLVLAPLVGIRFGLVELLQILGIMLLIAVGLTSLGLVIASRMASMEGFQVVMNFIIVPMWLLSGAFFPMQGVPAWMATLMTINPLTYAVDALRGVMAGSGIDPAMIAHGFGFNFAVIALLAVVCFGLAVLTFKSHED